MIPFFLLLLLAFVAAAAFLLMKLQPEFGSGASDCVVPLFQRSASVIGWSAQAESWPRIWTLQRAFRIADRIMQSMKTSIATQLAALIHSWAELRLA